MKLFIDPSCYHIANLGDMAMLTVTLRRIRDAVPATEVRVVNRHPEYFSSRVGPITFVDPLDRRAFYQGFLPDRFTKLISPDGLREWQLERTNQSPALARFLGQTIRKQKGNSEQYHQQLATSDALIITGGGVVNDSFLDLALSILDEADFMIRRKKSVFFFGLGLGPLDNPQLFAKAAAVLPRVNHLYLREGHLGIPLAKKLGIPESKYSVTGDDAIELAYSRRPQGIGSSIGLNLRLAKYSGLGTSVAEQIRPAIQDVARSVGASLRAVPISLLSHEMDREAVKPIMNGYENIPDPVQDLESIEGVIAEAGQCRVVITASYHAGVFALSQGVSVIGISASPYYDSKFQGLVQQFPGGCQFLTVGTTFTPERFEEMLRSTWEKAPENRPLILAAAAKQLELSHQAYQQVFEQIGLTTAR